MSHTISRLVLIGALVLTAPAGAKPKIHVAFHWHMHQPIYWPYEDFVTTADSGRWGFDVMQELLNRTGPYTSWPADAVQSGMGFDHLGAQVSFTGSLIENLNAIEGAGRGFAGWKGRWLESRAWTTALSNPRLDLVAISYHHPVLPLIAGPDRILQIALHKLALQQTFSAQAPSGMFPPETAFAAHIIPDLVDQGISWVLVDNIHFDRARSDYPYTAASNLVPPNPAEQRNTTGDVNWVQLSNIWAPSQVSAPWGYQPHRVEYIDPGTGAASSIIVVPAARYEGNEDARGGFGAFLYEQVMSQYEACNNDDAHPMLVVLHHDGDNYGGGTDSYYHGNFANFVAWLQDNPERFECTTIQDYLDRFPPDPADVIHVEPGSWSGADNGDPEFAKWNGDPGPDGYSPDRHSSAVITAAANRVHTAQAISPWTSLDAIRDGTGSETDKAWHYLLNAETSCYWYWDGSEDGKWDSHPARAANQAVAHADLVIGDGSNDTVPPDIFLPQREPYNPGGIEWGSDTMPSDFEVWTFVYDVSGLTAVTLHARVDSDGGVDADNHLYAGGTWRDIPMTGATIESRTDPLPTYKAQLYTATVDGVTQSLVDYYVSAEDTRGNTARSPLQHVFVGQAQGPAGGVGWWPNPATQQDTITVWGEKPGKLHWGVDDWTEPAQALWPAGTTAYGDGLSVESPLTGPNAQGRYTVDIGPFAGSGVEVIDFVMHYDDESWDNNNGSDYHIILLDERPDAGIDGADAGDGDVNGDGSDGDVVVDVDDGGDDAGVAADDAGDAGDKEEATTGGGCGCGSADSGKGLLMLGILALAFARRFRFALILVLIAVVGCQGPAEPVLDGGEDAADSGDGDGNGHGDDGGGGDDAGIGGDDAGTGDDGGDEGPVETCGETTFSYDAGATQVSSVLVSGSFNGWAGTVVEGAWEMTADGSVWSVTRVLESGRYLYKFIVDGNWIEDPSNPDREDDGLGGFNSVLVVDCGADLEVVSYSSNPAGSIDAVLRLTPAELILDAGSVVVTLDHQPTVISLPAVE